MSNEQKLQFLLMELLWVDRQRVALVDPEDFVDIANRLKLFGVGGTQLLRLNLSKIVARFGRASPTTGAMQLDYRSLWATLSAWVRRAAERGASGLGSLRRPPHALRSG